MQVGFVVFGYAAVSAVSAALLFFRRLQELKYPAEASGGMWAAGDLFLWIFIACLFLVPTALLIWFTAKYEAFYTAYSKFLLGLSLTAPLCLGVLNLGGNHVGESLMNLCMYRLMALPFIFVGMGFSRIVARFDRAKRLANYAVLIEGLTLVIAVALVIHSFAARK